MAGSNEEVAIVNQIEFYFNLKWSSEVGKQTTAFLAENTWSRPRTAQTLFSVGQDFEQGNCKVTQKAVLVVQPEMKSQKTWIHQQWVYALLCNFELYYYPINKQWCDLHSISWGYYYFFDCQVEGKLIGQEQKENIV